MILDLLSPHNSSNPIIVNKAANKERELKRLVQLTTTLLLSALVLATGPAFSADLSLRDTIRAVAEATDVFPLDVYMGTTSTDYGNWDCRYDLTYSQFRPNYVLYLTARNAEPEEITDLIERFPKLSPKEKALACAALVAFARSDRDIRQNSGSGERPATSFRLAENYETIARPDFSDEEKLRVKEALEKELNDRRVAFPKVDAADLDVVWEDNLRKVCALFMQTPRLYDGITARGAFCDLYAFYQPKDNTARDFFYLYDEWNGQTEQFPLDFLCSLVLAQAAFDQSELRDATIFRRFPKEQVRLSYPRRNERDVVARLFLKDRQSIPKFIDQTLEPMYEGVIMVAWLKTQFVASRRGKLNAARPICGNSSDRDVLVSDVIQKTLEFLSQDEETRAFESESSKRASTSDDTGIENERKISLLEKIRNEANDVEYFSLPMFLKLYKEADLNLYDYDVDKFPNAQGEACLTATYERFRVFNSIYEAAANASREEIAECLEAFDNLQPEENKAKAFILASTALYVLRATDAQTRMAIPGEKIVKPLSQEEMRKFYQTLALYSENKDVVFEAYEASRKEWEASFRENAFLLQKQLGRRNPIYVFSPGAEERWRSFCDEAPIVVLYSLLAAETRLDLETLLNDEKVGENATAYDETTLREINATRRFLRVQIGLTRRKLYFNHFLRHAGPGLAGRDESGGEYYTEPLSEIQREHGPRFGRVESQSFAWIANQILDQFPELKTY